jgi:carboxymethylenebutenolidase
MTPAPKITQEMINLYDEYTHITLDRRDFMDKLTALVGSTAGAVAVTSMIEANQAAAQIVQEGDNRLKTQTVKYPGEGGELTGYVAMPANASGKLGAIIVIHENRGLVPHIKDVARRMALEGFVVLAPDFLSQDGGTPEDEDKGRDMIAKLDMKRTIANAVASVNYLKGHASSNGRVGVVGFCWGGALTNQTAVNAGDNIKAAAPYYGRQPNAAETAKIKAPLLLHYASNDENINKGIDDYKKALDENKVKYQLFVYDGTQHAFNNDTSQARYNKQAADVAWSRTVAFFKQNLSSTS